VEALIGIAVICVAAIALIVRRRSPPPIPTRPVATLAPPAVAPTPRSTWAPPPQPRLPNLERIKNLPEEWIVLDVETTGIGPKSEILEIGIVDKSGNILMNCLVKPKGRIQSEASEVHRIFRKNVKNEKEFPHISQDFFEIMNNRAVICYNAEYEMALIKQTCDKFGIRTPHISFSCAMLAYAEYVGEPHKWRQGEYRWWKLAEALKREGIEAATSHRACADAEVTRQLVLAMQRKPVPALPPAAPTRPSMPG
jgi:DNA polymerase-3 subunit epsilon